MSKINNHDLIPPFSKGLKNNWANIDTKLFCTFKSDTEVVNTLQNIWDEIIIFCKDTLITNLLREYMGMVIIFLRGVPPKNIQFYKSGVYQLARWMSRAIYCLKIFIFLSQLLLC